MNDEARKIFVKNLDRLMRIRHVTQADIARNLELTASTVSDWYLGKKYPRVDRMQQLADYLGVPMYYLTAESNPYELPSLLSEEEQELVVLYRAAEETARKYARDMLASHPEIKQDTELLA